MQAATIARSAVKGVDALGIRMCTELRDVPDLSRDSCSPWLCVDMGFFSLIPQSRYTGRSPHRAASTSPSDADRPGGVWHEQL